MVLIRQCGDSGTVRGKVHGFRAGLLCGIGQVQKRAAYGVGCGGDTSPRNGSCTATWRLLAVNLLKAEQLREKSLRSGCCRATAG